MNRWELEKEIVLRALKDPTFKKQLETNPKAAIEEMLTKEGVTAEQLSQLNVRLAQEKENEIVIALPHLAQSGKPLSDSEAKQLAAGLGFNCHGTIGPE